MERQTNDAGLTLEEFVFVWNRNDNAFIPLEDGSFEINVTTMNAQKFVLLLQSMFGDAFNFEEISQYKIKAIPKEVKGSIVNNEPTIEPGSEFTPDYETEFKTPFESKEEVKKDLFSLAERLDNDFVTIEVDENVLTIKSENQNTLETVAKLADKIDENLSIEIFNGRVLIK